MNRRLLEHLTALYGRPAGSDVAQQLAGLMDAWRPRLPAAGRPRRGLPLTERDVLLVTYADQVREPEIPPLRSLEAFAAARLSGLVSGLHLLPFYPSSSDDGFAVKDYYAVDSTVGTWEDVARLGHAFELMFDAVFNHASAQGAWFQRFLAADPSVRDFFIVVEGQPDLTQVVRPRALPLLSEFATATGRRRVWTTFSADQVDLNLGNPEVLLRLTDALLFYVSQGARFIRLDAIAFLWKEIGTTCLHLPQTHRIIQTWRAVLDELAPHVLLITETNVPHAENLTYFGDGRSEAQLVYNFALPPLVLHSFRTGNAGALTAWARTLRPPSDHVTFLNFLASHDGIGLNPVRGILTDAEIDALVSRAKEHGGLVSYKHLPDGSRVPYELNINYLDALSNPAGTESPALAARKFLTAQAILLSLQGLPALYFHSALGSRGDPGGAASSGLPRRINRQKLDRGRLERELDEPGSLRSLVYRGCRELLLLRRKHPAFSPAASQHLIAMDPHVFALRRHDREAQDEVLCLHNVSDKPVVLPLGELDPGMRKWRPVWSFGACGEAAPSSSCELEPFGTVWLVAEL